MMQELNYIRCGDYYIPDIRLPEESRPIGRWGRMHRDGSDLQCATNPDDPDSFFPGANGQRSYNLLHINAMYDVLQHLYIDAVLQKRRDAVESGALTAMVDHSAINCIYVHTAPPY